VPIPSQESEQSCTCVLGVPSQESEQSCTCVLGVPSQENEQSCTCVLGVPSQENEQSCTCVLGVPSQESEQSCTCVLAGIDFASFYDFQTVYITIKVVSYSFPACGEVYLIKLPSVSDLWQVIGFL
jgi:hypothetical protein